MTPLPDDQRVTPEMVRETVAFLARQKTSMSMAQWEVHSHVLLRAADEIAGLRNLLRCAYEDVPGWVGDAAVTLGRVRHG